VTWCQTSDEPFVNNRALFYEIAKGEGRLPDRQASSQK
jgi:hypothetical protein